MAGTRRPGPRRLGIVVRTSPGALPVLVAAGFVSASACGESTEDRTLSFVDGDASSSAGAGGTSAAGTGGEPTANTGGFIFTESGGRAGSSGDGSDSSVPSNCNQFTVELPPEGTPTEPGQICSVSIDPVDSNRAARVTFVEGDAGTTLTGYVTFDPSVGGRVIGVPMVEVVGAEPPQLSPQFGPMTKVADGFEFDVRFPPPYVPQPGSVRMTVRTTFNVSCGPDGGSSKQVHSATDIYACDVGNGSPAWASSGDRCIVCHTIAEMAPSPIVPDKRADGLPLARVLRLRLIELARVANRVVLFAENDGGEGLDYEWHPSAGGIERLAPDVIVWTVADGMAAPLMQVAVFGESEAAVATWAWNRAA